MRLDIATLLWRRLAQRADSLEPARQRGADAVGQRAGERNMREEIAKFQREDAYYAQLAEEDEAPEAESRIRRRAAATVVARRGDYYLIATSAERGRILHADDRVSPELPLHGIISRGYWSASGLDADGTAAVLDRFQAACERLAATRRWSTVPEAPDPRDA